MYVIMKVKVYEYFGRHGIRTYTFLIGQDYISSIRIMGRKRVNLIKLFKKIKLEKRNPYDEFLMPDKEYSFYVSSEKKIEQTKEEIL